MTIHVAAAGFMLIFGPPPGIALSHGRNVPQHIVSGDESYTFVRDSAFPGGRGVNQLHGGR